MQNLRRLELSLEIYMYQAYFNQLNMHYQIDQILQFIIIFQRIIVAGIQEMKDDHALNKALQELQIRSTNTFSDREQLHQILFQILAYPSLEQAHVHHRANNMGTMDLLSKQKELERDVRNDNYEQMKVCPCCGVLVNNEELPYCVKFRHLKIGVGVILFYRNFMFNFVVFALMFLIYSIYSLVTNIRMSTAGTASSFQCYFLSQNQGCQNSLSGIGAGSKLYSANGQFDQKDRLSLIQSWIAIGFVILWGFLNIVKKHFQNKLVISMQTNRISASAFTLMLTHFPKIYLSKSYQENLQQINTIFKNYGKSINSLFSYEVVKYNIARPLYFQEKQSKQQREKLDQQRKKRQQVFRDWLEFRKKKTHFPVNHQQRINQYDKYIRFYTEKYDVRKQRELKLDQKNLLFVTLKSSSSVEQITKRNQPKSIKNLWGCFGQNDFPIKNVKIRRAPQPQQIKWKNVGFPNKSRNIRKALIWVITILLIGISLGISIGIAYINTQSLDQGVSIGISLIITIVNFGIQMSIMYLTYLQKDYIHSVEQTNVAIKIGVGQLVNSIGVPIIVTIISQKDSKLIDKSWLKAGGLVQSVFFIAIFNLAVPFGRLLDPWEIYLKIQRWWYSKPAQKIKMYGQKQLNQYYGNYEFDIGYEYAYLIKTSIFTAFFACMQPIIVLFAPIGIILYYFINKRNLLRHFQRPSFHSPNIDFAVDFILLLSPIAFGFGHLTVNNFIDLDHQNDTKILNWIIVIIGFAFFIIVPLNIFYYCIKRPEHPQWDYEQKMVIIPSDYDRVNPVTRQQAIGEFEDQLKRRDISDNPQAQLLRASASKLRLRNSRNNQKKDFKQSRIRMSKIQAQDPQYNTDVNKYQDYVKDPNHLHVPNGSAENLNKDI